MNVLLLGTLLALASFEQIAAVRKALLTNAGAWCTHKGATITTGDFDGDGLTDMMCYDHAGNHWIRYAEIFRQDEYLKNMKGWCRHGGSRRYIGDFNGDGRDDLLCHDSNGNAWIQTADPTGTLTGEKWHKRMGWCGHTGSQIHIGDFNGDGRADLLCHDVNTGHKWVALCAERHYFASGTSWEYAMGWCHTPSQLFVGYFNDDRLADIMCHSPSGQKWIAYAHKGEYFEGFKQAWYNAMGWCYHPGSVIRIADINFDNRDDMICHDKAGKTWTALNEGDDHFVGGTSASFNFCRGRNERFLTGNFVEDGREELICTESHTWIIKHNLIQ